MASEDLLSAIDARFVFADPSGSEARLRELRAQRADGYEQSVIDTQIARAQGLGRQYALADQTLDLVERAGHAAPELAVRVLLERGRVLNSQARREAARPLFEQAFALAEPAALEGLAVDALHMVAITWLADPPQALHWNLKALALAERSQQPRARKWLASLYNNLGYSYDDQGDYARALELFERGLQLRIVAGQPGPIRIARFTVAHALRELGRCDEARAQLEPLLRELEANHEAAGDVLQELGECELAQGRPETARPYFAQAYAALGQDAWTREHEADRLARLAQLGGVAASAAP